MMTLTTVLLLQLPTAFLWYPVLARLIARKRSLTDLDFRYYLAFAYLLGIGLHYGTASLVHDSGWPASLPTAVGYLMVVPAGAAWMAVALLTIRRERTPKFLTATTDVVGNEALTPPGDKPRTDSRGRAGRTRSKMDRTARHSTI